MAGQVQQPPGGDAGTAPQVQQPQLGGPVEEPPQQEVPNAAATPGAGQGQLQQLREATRDATSTTTTRGGDTSRGLAAGARVQGDVEEAENLGDR